MYKLFRAIKHQIEKGPVDARVKKAKYTLNDTGLLGDDVEYSVLVRRAGAEITLALKIFARLRDRSADTEHGYRGNRPKPPQATGRVCATSIFGVGVLGSGKTQAARPSVSGCVRVALDLLHVLRQPLARICVSVVGANVNTAIFF